MSVLDELTAKAYVDRIIAEKLATENLPLLHASPHQWGYGQIHQIDPHINPDSEKTLCGKPLNRCPGEKRNGPVDLITCKVCLSVRATRARNIEWEARQQLDREFFHQVRQERRETDYQKKQRQWREAYNRYLLSGEWFAKRAKVMLRANDICEGCGLRRAVQVHHLRYPRNCQPGSDQWIAQEKLFDLRAICRECHDDVHQR
jgi:hypothetical protein